MRMLGAKNTIGSLVAAGLVVFAVQADDACERCNSISEEITSSGDKWMYQPDLKECGEPKDSDFECIIDFFETEITVDVYVSDGEGGWNWARRFTMDENQCYHNDTDCVPD
jgi:hypothetical protein